MLGNCEHELRITGKSIDIKRILDYIVDGEFDFDKIIPEPRTREECLNCCEWGNRYIIDTKSNLREDWFDSDCWRCWFWYSEWKGIVTKLQRISENEVLICYNTYIHLDVFTIQPIIVKLQELYPNIDIKYSLKYYPKDDEYIHFINYTTKDGWSEYREDNPDWEGMQF